MGLLYTARAACAISATLFLSYPAGDYSLGVSTPPPKRGMLELLCAHQCVVYQGRGGRFSVGLVRNIRGVRGSRGPFFSGCVFDVFEVPNSKLFDHTEVGVNKR